MFSLVFLAALNAFSFVLCAKAAIFESSVILKMLLCGLALMNTLVGWSCLVRALEIAHARKGGEDK